MKGFHFWSNYQIMWNCVFECDCFGLSSSTRVHVANEIIEFIINYEEWNAFIIPVWLSSEIGEQEIQYCSSNWFLFSYLINTHSRTHTHRFHLNLLKLIRFNFFCLYLQCNRCTEIQFVVHTEIMLNITRRWVKLVFVWLRLTVNKVTV